jgi:autotransporter-associated beta strand protein
LGDVAGAFNLNNNSANAVTFNQTAGLTSLGVNNRTLTVGGSGAGGVNFMGGLENGSSTASLSLRVNNSSTTVRIDAASTYTGGTILDAGTIALGSATALGTGNLTINGGGIASISSARTIANNITANGDFKLGGLNQSLTLNGTLGLGGGTRTISLGNSATVNGVISNGGLSVFGDGTANIRTMTIANANNTYTGATTVSGANIVVSGSIASSSGTTVGNLGSLTVNGAASGVTVNSGGSLLGSGTVGNVTLNSGSFLKPGNSPGNLTATSSVWNSGATYEWQITSLTGTAGTDWDLFTVSGALNLNNLSSSAKFNLTLDSGGALAGFSDTADYSWTFAKAASITGITTTAGTDITSLFNIASGNFNGGVGPTNGFKVLVGETTGGYTSLNIVPEPSTPALMGLGMVALLAVRSMRRRLS